ncbi:DUF5131 family protein [Actinophytocola sediminis]
MADRSGIEWTDATWSPTLGCARVSPGCDNCYAIRTVHRLAHNPNPKIEAAAEGLTAYRPGVGLMWTGAVRTLPARLDLPLSWRKPRMIFVDSQSDLFHDHVPDEFIARVFAVMSQAPQHTFQILTKRHGRMRSLLSSEDFRSDAHSRAIDLVQNRTVEHAFRWPLPNVWIGVSVEDQQRANLRIQTLLDTPAAVRWLSCEPLLGPVDLKRTAALGGDVLTDLGVPGTTKVDWVVAGGESGPGARPMHPAWARSLRDQCVGARVPFHFKQWGAWAPIGPLYGEGDEVEDAHMEAVHLEVHGRRQVAQVEPDGTVVDPREYQPGAGTWLMARVGKGKAGRQLDGRTWDEYPSVSAGAGGAG